MRRPHLAQTKTSASTRALTTLTTQKHRYMQGIATFTPAKDPNETLNGWSNNINELLSKVEKMCHLIHKENMVHGIRK